MIVKVEMQAFQNGVIREVNVPDPAWGTASEISINAQLEAVFMYGQNDFQPVPNRCSVSTGDVIQLNGKRYEVDIIGFKELDQDFYP